MSDLSIQLHWQRMLNPYCKPASYSNAHTVQLQQQL